MLSKHCLRLLAVAWVLGAQQPRRALPCRLRKASCLSLFSPPHWTTSNVVGLGSGPSAVAAPASSCCWIRERDLPETDPPWLPVATRHCNCVVACWQKHMLPLTSPLYSSTSFIGLPVPARCRCSVVIALIGYVQMSLGVRSSCRAT